MSQEQIWAPWRMAYIVQPEKHRSAPQLKGDRCFLCHYATAPAEDAENYVIERTEYSLVVLNRFPYGNGHLLIAPRQHLADLSDLPEELLTDGVKLLQKWTGLLRTAMNPDGFNVGLNLGRAAGAGVPGHLHWHIVPRWNGDTSFMPVLGDTSVIPQSLAAMREYLLTLI